MRNFLLGCAAAAALITALPASAADLPTRRVAVAPAPAPVYVAPVFTWTGFYIGANAGGAWRHHDNGFFGDRCGRGLDGVTVDNCGSDLFDDDDNVRFTGGLTLGVNWQIGAFVLGVEGDINYLDNGDDDHFGFGDVAFNLPTVGQRRAGGINVGGLGLERDPFGYVASWHGNGDDDDNWFGTLRGRGGIAFDRFLVYATGGVVFGGNQAFNDFGSTAVVREVATGAIATTLGGGPAIYQAGFRHDDDEDVHWTVGGGFEFALTDNVTLKLEYLHVFFDNGGDRFTVDPIATAFFGDRVYVNGNGGDNNRDIDIVRAGINFKTSGFFGLF